MGAARARRAARFNVEVRAPEKRLDLRQEARKKAALERRKERPSFVTGMDLFSEVRPRPSAKRQESRSRYRHK